MSKEIGSSKKYVYVCRRTQHVTDFISLILSSPEKHVGFGIHRVISNCLFVWTKNCTAHFPGKTINSLRFLLLTTEDVLNFKLKKTIYFADDSMTQEVYILRQEQLLPSAEMKRAKFNFLLLQKDFNFLQLEEHFIRMHHRLKSDHGRPKSTKKRHF